MNRGLPGKRVLCLMLAAVLLLSAAACGQGSAPDTTVPDPDPAPTEPVPAEPVPEPDLEPEPELEPWTWNADTPDAQGLRGDALPALHETYASFPLLSAMIVKNGRVVDTYYREGYDETRVFVLNSASKSVTSALVGIAIQRGDIGSVDDLLADYLPRVRELSDHRWQEITLRQLLTHTSGLASTDSERWTAWRSSEKWLEYIFALPFAGEPGSGFSYSTGNTHLLSAVLQSATGVTLSDFAQGVLCDPLGLESARVDADPQGIGDGGNGVWMTTADMAKFGLLYLNSGQWQGQQLVPAAWVEQSTSAQYERGGGRAAYGFQWWVRSFGDEKYPAYFAQGHGGQYILVVPQLALVVAWNSGYEGATSIYWQMADAIVNACFYRRCGFTVLRTSHRNQRITPKIRINHEKENTICAFYSSIAALTKPGTPPSWPLSC